MYHSAGKHDRGPLFFKLFSFRLIRSRSTGSITLITADLSAQSQTLSPCGIILTWTSVQALFIYNWFNLSSKYSNSIENITGKRSDPVRKIINIAQKTRQHCYTKLGKVTRLFDTRIYAYSMREFTLIRCVNSCLFDA